MITVVAALIKKENKVLIAKRKTGNPAVLGNWEFPGGKVNDNEDEISAIKREIKEEFSIDIEVIKYLCETNNENIILKLYECKYISGDFNLKDHYEYKYVSLDEILDYDLAPLDIKLINNIK